MKLFNQVKLYANAEMNEDTASLRTSVTTLNELYEMRLKIHELEKELSRQQDISSNTYRAHLKYDYDFNSDSLH